MFNKKIIFRLLKSIVQYKVNSFKKDSINIFSCLALSTVILSSSVTAAQQLKQTSKNKTSAINLLKDKNPQFFKNKIKLYMMDGYSYANDSHTKDGSGSAKLDTQGAAAYGKALMTPTFKLEKGKRYTMSVYMKMVGMTRGQNIFFKVIPRGNLGKSWEFLYNVAKPGEWEEAIIPFRPTESGDYIFCLFIHKYGYSTDGKLIKPDLSNMGKSPIIYYDDFSVVESDHIVSREPYTEKVPFASSIVKIDKLGNWSVKENGKWKNIFPRQVYQTWLPDFAQNAKYFHEYGFNGYVNITDIQRLKLALAAGLKYNSIQINNLNANTKKLIKNYLELVDTGTLPPTAIIMYTYDNEGTYMAAYKQQQIIAKWLDGNKNGRIRPIFVLNGVAEGLARTQKSSHLNFMDVTGSYTDRYGQSSDLNYVPADTLLMLDRIHNQQAPVSVIQLQSYYNKSFIPMLFKGIIGGGKSLQFWRGGVTYSGSKKDFRENYWAPAIKGPNGVFAKIDKMLPIIREPQATAWRASITQTQKDTITIGERTHAGKHYIIMANFADKDQQVKITLNGIRATKVKDYFTQQKLTIVKDGSFNVKIGHFNDGYKVLVVE